ncbi:MAG: hydrogenase [Sulfurimonas sp.]|uniref:hydrogenase n=1 Tax=Sulfurimonas sp. TaxID=2022749 RepID=UPI0025F61B26|nr:hydrogenase [Sulfurimonas sp.]MCK9490646.1 hydrogenase [Sulfurimonas sp.]
MILEFSFNYLSSSLIYEKIILRTLGNFALDYKMLRDKDELFLYVEGSDDELEAFAQKLSLELPHSIFLYATDAKIVEIMPEQEALVLDNKPKLSMPFCPKCLAEVMDESDKNYYNIFHECEVCGYDEGGESRSYKEELTEIAKEIGEGSSVSINTFYGKYLVGKLDKNCSAKEFDIISYDLGTIAKYTNATNSEIAALGAIEKPLIKLKTNVKFKMDFEDVTKELIRFKMPDDLVLHLLLCELNKLGIDLIFISKDEVANKKKFELVEQAKKQEPIEIVVGDNHLAIVSGQKGLPYENLKEDRALVPYIGAFFSVIKEHKLEEKTVAGINLSKDYHNNILIYSKKFGMIEYLSFKFNFDSIEDVFNKITASDESGKKLVENFKNSNPEHFNEIRGIVFEKQEFNVYKLWGIVAIVLGLTKEKKPFNAAKVIEENATLFLGTKGPRIDYKPKRIDSKVYLDPLMCIRTAMSFKLAKIDDLTLCFGVIESFVEFLSSVLDEIKDEMKSDAVVVTGSLLQNRGLFSKLAKEASANHKVYFNKELPIDGRNILYGGNELI